jgi:long-chain fatty acid transport protein
MFRRLSIIAFLFFTLMAFFCNVVFANGFKNDALLDTEATGMATVYVAQADSPSAVQFNPAGLTQLKGDYVRVGYTSAIPRNFRTDASGDESRAQVDNFLVPNLYFVNSLGAENWKFGLGVTSPYGLGTDWADDSFARFQTTESMVNVLQINPTAAYKLNDVISVGFGIDYIMSQVDSKKRIADGDAGGGSSGNGGFGVFRLKGDDDAWGYNVGLLVRPSEKHSIGISYRSKIDLTYKGKIFMSNLSSGIYGPGGYGIFPNDNYETGMEDKLTLPQTISLGYAFRPNSKWTFEADGIWTDWSSVQEDFVKFTEESDTNILSVLNDGNPTSKNWHPTMSYGVSAKYQATDKLVLRCGYLYAETPVPAANFEPSMVDMNMHCVSLGAGYQINDRFNIDAAYFVGFYKDRYITNDVASATSNLDGMYESYVNVISIGFTYKY